MNFSWKEIFPIFAHPSFGVRHFQHTDCAVAFLQKENLGIKRATLFSEVFSLSDKVVSPAMEKDLFEAFVARLKADHVHVITQPHPQALPQSAITGSKSVPFGSYRLFLQGRSEDELLARCHSKHRNSIRKAEKDGVTISIGHQFLAVAIQTINETMLRQHMPLLTQDYFAKLSKSLGEHMFVAVAEHNKVPQAACILFWSKYSAYYSYGGTIAKPSSGSMNYLLWTAAMQLKSSGCNRFDFVGARLNPDPESKYAGIQAFKERFGGELIKGYLWKMNLQVPQAFGFRFLERFASFAKGKSFKGDIIDQELARVGGSS